jgi:purine-binding chemotaxis protein CheW
MSAQSYFTFRLNHQRYGINSTYIDEIFALPELTPFETTSQDIVGFVNLREDILPVLDLNLSLGFPLSGYKITDSLVILKWDDLRIGIIVHEIHEMLNMFDEEIRPKASSEFEGANVIRKRIILGTVKRLETIIILSNPGDWLWYSEIQQFLILKDTPITEVRDDDINIIQLSDPKSDIGQLSPFYRNITLGEREIFRRRAKELKIPKQGQDKKNLKPLIVFTLSHHLFGIDIAAVREFIDIRKVTPIPCCPGHIIGNINLRGEILTIIDICKLLIPSILLTSRITTSKAMVIERNHLTVGLIVDEINDTMFALNQDDILPPSSINPSSEINEKYLQGLAVYRGKTLGILDISKLLSSSELIVDELV